MPSPTFDPSRETQIAELLQGIRPAIAVRAPDDYDAELAELIEAAQGLEHAELSERRNRGDALQLSARTLDLAAATRPAPARRAAGQVMGRRIEARATGLGVYTQHLGDAWLRIAGIAADGEQPAFLRAVGHVMLVEAAIETLEAIVLADRGVAADAATVHRPPRAATIDEVEAVAAAALAEPLDHVPLDEWQEPGRQAFSDGFLDDAASASQISGLLINLYSLGRPESAIGSHSRAFRHALIALETFGDDPLPRLITAAATAIDGSGLGGGARPWVATSVDASMVDAILIVGSLDEEKRSDDADQSFVISSLRNIAQRELVLLWCLGPPA